VKVPGEVVQSALTECGLVLHEAPFWQRWALGSGSGQVAGRSTIRSPASSASVPLAAALAVLRLPVAGQASTLDTDSEGRGPGPGRETFRRKTGLRVGASADSRRGLAH
jgi:hypothetical protein